MNEILHHPKKAALFIDGANLHATAKALQFDLDYRRLLAEFEMIGGAERTDALAEADRGRTVLHR